MKSQQYHNRLTAKEAADGIKIILENSKSLFSDAELLLENNRNERSITLSIIAVEECGKIPIIRSILLEDEEKELKKLWKDFRTHTEKNWGLMFSKFHIESVKKLEGFKFLFNKSTNWEKEFDYLKQLTLYTDIHGAKEWHSPSLKFEYNLAKDILETARLFVGKDLIAMSTEPELELWIKHLKPVWKKDMNSMKTALLACYTEAERLGILSGTRKVEDMKKFLF